MCITGLDRNSPLRLISLKVLPDHRFLVQYADTVEDITRIPAGISVATIALADRQISQGAMAFPDAQLAWDYRDASYVSTGKKTLEKTLAPFYHQSVTIKAVDVESEAMARALYLLCGVTEQCFALLYCDDNHLWVSVFREAKKIFFHEELLENNNEAILYRAFKLFRIHFPSVQITQRYVIGKGASHMTKWGIMPDITQRLDFETEYHRKRLQKENTQWLLACGLSLWQKESGWNLLPWRESEKQAQRKLLGKQLLKIFIYACSALILAHLLLLLWLYRQTSYNVSLDKKISQLKPQTEHAFFLQEEIDTLNKQLGLLKQFSTKQHLPVKNLKQLDQIIPQGVYLDTLMLENQKIALTGHAETDAQINTLVSRLKQYPFFRNAHLKSKTQDTLTRLYPFKFTIEMELV